MNLSQFTSAWGTAKTIFSFLGTYWWIYTPVVLYIAVIQLWKTYARMRYLSTLKWVLLEVKPPPDVQKSPKIAENMFAGLHGIYKGGTGWKEMFFQGKLPNWFSFEIVGSAGDMRFYIRTLEELKNLVEVVIFAQYPDAEITLVEDYVDRLPRSLPSEEYDLFGTELVFTKEDAYPIKTYPEFEEEGSAKETEFKRTDPLAPLAEIVSALGPGEHLWLQLLARPTGDAWVKSSQSVIDALLGKKPASPPRGVLGGLTDIIGSLFSTAPATAVPEKKEPEASLGKLTPGKRFVLEQVENKMSKLGFKAGYRFVYVARKDTFNRSRVPALIGMFKQMYSNNLNTFKPNGEVTTSDKGWFSWIFPSDKGFLAGPREFRKKYTLFQKYRRRDFVKKHVILNTEELATVFHMPGISIRAPGFPRVEAKKGQPPSGLPIK